MRKPANVEREPLRLGISFQFSIFNSVSRDAPSRRAHFARASLSTYASIALCRTVVKDCWWLPRSMDAASAAFGVRQRGCRFGKQRPWAAARRIGCADACESGSLAAALQNVA